MIFQGESNSSVLSLYSFLVFDGFLLIVICWMAIKREETCLKDVYDLYDEAHLYARNVVYTYILYTNTIRWKRSNGKIPVPCLMVDFCF